MTDNKDLYVEYLRLQGCPEHGKDYDKYYVIELMRRGKDNPDLPAANVHFKNYYIDSIDKFNARYEEIKAICTLLRLRAYFSVNYKSCQQILLDTISEGARRAAQHDYKKPWSIYESCSGKFSSKNDKKWVVDIDDCNINDDLVNRYITIINTMCTPSRQKVIAIFPTRSGVHLITKPFNKQEFWNYCNMNDFKIPDIKDNHLSLLYENL